MEEDQDGGVGGCGVHIPDKYIKNTSTCREIHIGSWQKTSYTTKAAKRSPYNWIDGREKASGQD